MSLLEHLKETFPEETVEPFGNVLVIPAKAFKQDWKQQLESERVRIYDQSWHRAACFFLKEPSQTAQSVKAEKNAEVSVEPLKLTSRSKRVLKDWSSEEEAQLKGLFSQGVPIRNIASKLGQSQG